MFLPLSLALLCGCQPLIPDDALRLSDESSVRRRIQTRVYATGDETKVLMACAALLQDMGFNIDESESELGVIVGSKDRSAVNAGRVIGSIVVGALTGTYVPHDKNQKMRASVITGPAGEHSGRIAVRVTFQRIVWDTSERMTKREGLTDPNIYREFFDKLSKSLFLEAQEAL